MQFFSPGPAGVVATGSNRRYSRGGVQGNTTEATRAVVGANGKVSLVVSCLKRGQFRGSIGNYISVTLFRMGANRFALQFFYRNGTQIDGNVVATGGLANIVAAFEAKVDLLSKNFTVKVYDATDQVQDSSSGFNGKGFLTGGAR